MAKKNKKKPILFDRHWAEAKQRCRLNMDDVQMAKELGLDPRSLIKNIPAPGQTWKASVKIWIRGLYEKMLEKRGRKQPRPPSVPKLPAAWFEDEAVPAPPGSEYVAPGTRLSADFDPDDSAWGICVDPAEFDDRLSEDRQPADFR